MLELNLHFNRSCINKANCSIPHNKPHAIP